MKLLLVALLWTGALHAQVGTLAGTISDAKGPLDRVAVRVRASAGQGTYAAQTDAKGTYSIRVRPGTYDVFATVVGHGAFAQRGVAVKAGERRVVDAVLSTSGNEGFPGELTYLHLGGERDAPKGPAPKAANGRPDLSGVWYPSADLEPATIPFLPWAAEFARTHTPGSDPRARCLPSGVARANQSELSKIVQTGDLIVMLYEGSPPGFRQIFLDGRAHPSADALDPSWMGHSVGHWEGKTLVVDTVGFNDRGWVDFRMTPQTEKLHVVERYRRSDRGHIDMEITVEDPGAYERAWKIRRQLTLAAKSEEIREYVCNENNSAVHMPQ
jgi:hypothetical protein